jgi:hypothetical protein
MELKTYIRQIGVEQFCQDLGVSKRAAQSWLYGARRPSIEVAQRIVATTPVSLDSIVTNVTVQDAEAVTQ